MNKKKILFLLGHAKCGTRWLADVILDTKLFFHIGEYKVFPKGIKFKNINKSMLIEMEKSDKNLFFIDSLMTEVHSDVEMSPYANRLEIITKLFNNYEVIPIVIYRDTIDVLTSYYHYHRFSGKYYGDFNADNKEYEVENYNRSFEKSFLPGGLLYKIYKLRYNYPKTAIAIRKYFNNYIELDYYDILNNKEKALNQILLKTGIKKEIKFNKLNTFINKTYAPRSMWAHKIIWRVIKILIGVDSTTLNDLYRSNKMKPCILKFALIINEKKRGKSLSNRQKNKIKNLYQHDINKLRDITGLKLNSWNY